MQFNSFHWLSHLGIFNNYTKLNKYSKRARYFVLYILKEVFQKQLFYSRLLKVKNDNYQLCISSHIQRALVE